MSPSQPEVRKKAERLDERLRPLLARIGVPLLRISLGVVFLWFGFLKIFDVSPVSGLVANTIYWFDPDVVVPALGAFEVFVGACLVAGRLMRIALPLLVLQMAGTFMVLVLLPDVAFSDGNPLLLTVEGEFVVKNLVLLSAALVIGSRLAPLGEGGSGSA
ncbi:MAG: DoxX family protein [Actinomycetota bacterium]|nr:DoxX family membrane protein [Actinomycetota bacterium]